MTVLTIILSVLTSALLVSANPATLQGLYDTPHGGHNHHSHGVELSSGSGTAGLSNTGNSAASSGSDFVFPGSQSSGSGVGVSDSSFSSGQAGSSQQSVGKVSGAEFGRLAESASEDSASSLDSSSGVVLQGPTDASNLAGSFRSTGTSGSVPTPVEFVIGQDSDTADVTVTQERTIDVFKTVTNLFYNSVPVTLTEFMKTTVVSPTLEVLSTPVDDHVFVATAPVTRTDTVTVTDTNTAFQCATEVSTEFYTITHRAYDIQQQVVSSTIVQTQVLRPTVVRTLITTEFDTETVRQTITNTVVVEPRTVSTIAGGPGALRLQQEDQFVQQDQQQFVQTQFSGRLPARFSGQQNQQGGFVQSSQQFGQQDRFRQQQAADNSQLRQQLLAAQRLQENRLRLQQPRHAVNGGSYY